MNKKSQICNASEAIQELTNLISSLHGDYSTEQAAAYYKEIFKMNMLKPGDNDAIAKPPYIFHVCNVIKELAKFVCLMEREGVTAEQIIKRINLIADVLRIEEEIQ